MSYFRINSREQERIEDMPFLIFEIFFFAENFLSLSYKKTVMHLFVYDVTTGYMSRLFSQKNENKKRAKGQK